MNEDDRPTIPVVWWNANPDAIARGYWDQGFLVDLLDGAAWWPGGRPGAENMLCGFDGAATTSYDEVPPYVASGAIVVVPARHNAEPTERRALVAFLDKLPWALVICTGDEEGVMPWDELAADNRLVWAMGATETNHDGVHRPLGSGYPPWLRGDLARAGRPLRQVPVSFAGQDTHDRRHEAIAALALVPDAEVHPSAGFTQGLPHDQYAALLVASRTVACPSGPVALDSFRVYEALEAGAVPLADACTPDGVCAPSYWHYVFGEVPPFPVVADWSMVGETANMVRSAATLNRVRAWYLGWKRRMAHHLLADLTQLSGEAWDMTPDAQITVLMVTSPIPSCPDTSVITETLRSIRAQLPTVEVLIGFDGVRPEQENMRGAYTRYTETIIDNCAAGEGDWWNVCPVVLDEWGHQANVTRRLLEEVRSPLVLFVEHDTPMVGEVDWPNASAAVQSGALNVLRFHHETDIGEYHRHLMLEQRPGMRFDQAPGLPVVRTVQWSQRPHLASTRFYREFVMPRFRPSGHTMIEDVMHSVVAHAFHDNGESGWWDWRVGIYAPEGNMQRSIHLDGRAGDVKYEQQP